MWAVWCSITPWNQYHILGITETQHACFLFSFSFGLYFGAQTLSYGMLYVKTVVWKFSKLHKLKWVLLLDRPVWPETMSTGLAFWHILEWEEPPYRHLSPWHPCDNCVRQLVVHRTAHCPACLRGLLQGKTDVQYDLKALWATRRYSRLKLLGWNFFIIM